MHYRMTELRETVGHHRFRLRCLRDFDEAVDDMFLALDQNGDGERLIELCPFFGKLWPSARALARHLEALGEAQLSGLRVLEVGCGLALPSLVAARLGARVIATDFHPDVERFLRDNLELNGVCGVEYVGADWRSDAAAFGRFDVVVGSDVLYDREHAESLPRFLVRHVREGGTVLIADPGRAYLQDFQSRMTAMNFSSLMRVETVEDGTDKKDVFLLEFRRELLH